MKRNLWAGNEPHDCRKAITRVDIEHLDHAVCKPPETIPALVKSALGTSPFYATVPATPTEPHKEVVFVVFKPGCEPAAFHSRLCLVDVGPSDSHNLNRFVEAQESSYAQALAEMRAGRKRSHWSWYLLPQLRGLGSSPMSVRYAISGLVEAKAYLEHPILGVRLRETVSALNAHNGLSAAQILGPIDAQKFRSCLTLFNKVDGADPMFLNGLRKYFAAAEDPLTITMLARKEKEC